MGVVVSFSGLVQKETPPVKPDQILNFKKPVLTSLYTYLKVNSSELLVGNSMKKPQLPRVNIYKSWCKHCGICTAFCPKGALQRDTEDLPYLADPDKCIGCHLCELRCPDFAIAFEEIENDATEKRKK